MNRTMQHRGPVNMTDPLCSNAFSVTGKNVMNQCKAYCNTAFGIKDGDQDSIMPDVKTSLSLYLVQLKWMNEHVL